MRTIEQMTSSEVHYCVSSLIATLAQGYDTEGAIAEICSQAMELAAPIDDWEEAALQESWQANTRGLFVNNRTEETAIGPNPNDACGWEDLCREFDIEPYQREVFEHWIVSDWLADKLTEHGEKVDKDFAGLTVWARTTTGQAIYADAVIERIYAALART